MKTLHCFTVPASLTYEQMQALATDCWQENLPVPYPCELIRLAPGDNLVIENLPEGEDIEIVIQTISRVLNSPLSQVALIVREGLTLQRCGSHQ